MKPFKGLFRSGVSGRSERRPYREYRKRRTFDDFSALIDAIRAEGRAYRNEEQQEDKGKRFREWITICLLGATLLAIVLQVREMQRAYGPIRDQAKASAQAAAATQKAADAAMKQVQNAEQNTMQAQRAWVGPTNAALPTAPQPGKAIDVTVVYQNTGHEPALAFSYNIDAFEMRRVDTVTAVPAPRMDSYKKFCQITRHWPGGSAVYPNSSYTLTDELPANTVDQGFAIGQELLVIQGCFQYLTFNLPKYSYFCYYYDPSRTKIANLSICPIGADAN